MLVGSCFVIAAHVRQLHVCGDGLADSIRAKARTLSVVCDDDQEAFEPGQKMLVTEKEQKCTTNNSGQTRKNEGSSAVVSFCPGQSEPRPPLGTGAKNRKTLLIPLSRPCEVRAKILFKISSPGSSRDQGMECRGVQMYQFL